MKLQENESSDPECVFDNLLDFKTTCYKQKAKISCLADVNIYAEKVTRIQSRVTEVSGIAI